MAILQAPANEAFGLFDLDRNTLPPAGTYVATIIDVRDKMGVVRQKFQSPETETVDLTAFLFGYRTPDGAPHKIDTRPMKISGHPNAALYKFLCGLLGRPPQYGWDYVQLKGSQCLLTVTHMVSQQNKPYAAVTAAVPLPAGFGQAQPAVAAQPAPAPAVYAPPQPAPAPAPVIPVADDDEEDIPF